MSTQIKSLVAEDSLVQGKVMYSMLSPYGMCLVAPNGKEALKEFEAALKDDPFDMVFVDLVMPIMDRFQLIKAIRELEDDIKINPVPIIICTGLEDMRDLCRAFYDRKNVSFIAKPIHPVDIKSEICRYLCLRGKLNEMRNQEPSAL